MQKLIIGFSYAPGKAFSKLIQTVTKSKSSHTFVVLEVAGETVIYQASGLCVNYHHKDVFNMLEVVTGLYEFDITDKKAESNRLFRIQNAGKPYSWREVIGYGAVLIARAFGRTVNNPYSAGNTAYVCVDISAAHLPCNPELVDGSMTPEDLRRFCEKNGRRVQVLDLAP